MKTLKSLLLGATFLVSGFAATHGQSTNTGSMQTQAQHCVQQDIARIQSQNNNPIQESMLRVGEINRDTGTENIYDFRIPRSDGEFPDELVNTMPAVDEDGNTIQAYVGHMQVLNNHKHQGLRLDANKDVYVVSEEPGVQFNLPDFAHARDTTVNGAAGKVFSLENAYEGVRSVDGMTHPFEFKAIKLANTCDTSKIVASAEGVMFITKPEIAKTEKTYQASVEETRDTPAKDNLPGEHNHDHHEEKNVPVVQHSLSVGPGLFSSDGSIIQSPGNNSFVDEISPQQTGYGLRAEYNLSSKFGFIDANAHLILGEETQIVGTQQRSELSNKQYRAIGAISPFTKFPIAIGGFAQYEETQNTWENQPNTKQINELYGAGLGVNGTDHDKGYALRVLAGPSFVKHSFNGDENDQYKLSVFIDAEKTLWSTRTNNTEKSITAGADAFWNTIDLNNINDSFTADPNVGRKEKEVNAYLTFQQGNFTVTPFYNLKDTFTESKQGAEFTQTEPQKTYGVQLGFDF